MARWIDELGQWLVTHLVLLGFVAFLAVAVVFRADLFSVFREQPPRGASAEEKVVVEARRPPVARSETKPNGKGSQAPEQVFRPLAPNELDAVARSAAPSGERSSGPSPLRPTRPEGHPAAAVVGQESASAEQPASTGMTDLSPDALLVQAREAFRSGRLEEAETLYRRYIRRRPDDPDGFGELGNVYHALGRDEAARDAYFQAGLRLKLGGDEARLARLRQWLENVGDPRARDLVR